MVVTFYDYCRPYSQAALLILERIAQSAVFEPAVFCAIECNEVSTICRKPLLDLIFVIGSCGSIRAQGGKAALKISRGPMSLMTTKCPDIRLFLQRMQVAKIDRALAQPDLQASRTSFAILTTLLMCLC